MTTTTYEQALPRFADGITVGTELAPATHRPTNVQLFRYCAVTWNAHRIHFDPDYAASEGYPGVLVQSHLHGAFLTGLCTDWMGLHGELRRLQYSVRRFACPGDELTCRGTVTSIDDSDPSGVVLTVDLREIRESDEVECAIGNADVFLPYRATVTE